MVVVTAVVYWICSRHASGEGRDVALMEQMIFVVPLLAVLAVFLTGLVPGMRSWWWLGRAILASFVGTAIFSYRIIEGFGSGAKGQDAAFVISFMGAGVAASLATAVAAALIRADQDPAFADWFRLRPVVGSTLTLLAAVPIGVVLLIGASTVGGLALGFWSVFRK